MDCLFNRFWEIFCVSLFAVQELENTLHIVCFARCWRTTGEHHDFHHGDNHRCGARCLAHPAVQQVCWTEVRKFWEHGRCKKEYANSEKGLWFCFHFVFFSFAWMSLAATLHVWRCLGIDTWDHAFASFFSGTIWSRRLLRLNDVSGSKSSFFWMTPWRPGRPFGSGATFKCRAGRDDRRIIQRPDLSEADCVSASARVRGHVHHLHHSHQLATLHGRCKTEDRISRFWRFRNLASNFHLLTSSLATSPETGQLGHLAAANKLRIMRWQQKDAQKKRSGRKTDVTQTQTQCWQCLQGKSYFWC